MSSGSSGGEDLGTFVAVLLQIIFNLTLPITVLGTCLASYVLKLLGFPEFAVWAALTQIAIEAAEANLWIALALAGFILAAIPLAIVALRERQLTLSGAVLDLVLTLIVFAFLAWLRTVWPYERRVWQEYAYGFLLFLTLAGVLEVILNTVGLIAHFRQSRPAKPGPPPQRPHGNSGQDRPRGEPETI